MLHRHLCLALPVLPLLALPLLALPGCRSLPLNGRTPSPAAPCALSPAPAAPLGARPASPCPPGQGSASVMVQTMGNWRGPPGYVRYEGDVVAIDGVPYRARRKAFRVPAGKHVITVAWANYQVPEWAGVDDYGETGVSFLREGVSDTELTAEAGRYYEVIWPYDDEPGGPQGFRDITSRR